MASIKVKDSDYILNSQCLESYKALAIESYKSELFHALNRLVLTMPMLKMLGLYLYTLTIGHKSCYMLSILNKLIL